MATARKISDRKLVEAFLATAGIPVDPQLPADWDCTPHDDRPACHRKIWGRPYITSPEVNASKFYELRVLDGGAWDRSSWKGSFDSLSAAKAAAKRVSFHN